jgi:hypothetical protein
MRAHAAVAQLVEQRIRNAKVASSTPASGTIQEHLPGRACTGSASALCFPALDWKPVVKKLILLSLLVLPCLALAEDDGDELLGLMEKPATRETALQHIDNVRTKWDGSVFCIATGNPQAADNPQAAAFVAVKSYLENHPEERYRPRRYLIIQGLRAAFPCRPR